MTFFLVEMIILTPRIKGLLHHSGLQWVEQGF
jgi:hypothetical protein